MKKQISIVPSKTSVFCKVFLFIVISISLCNTNQAQEMIEIIKDDSFLIVEKPQEIYEGMYKYDEPFQGYFAKGTSDFLIVDYYEKGQWLYQYSRDILKAVHQEEISEELYEEALYKPKLDIKSLVKNGEIHQGYRYTEIKEGILTENYKGGEFQGAFIDFFGVHYFNRITITKEKSGFEVSSFQEPEYLIKVLENKNTVVKEFWEKGKAVKREYAVDKNQSTFPANCVVNQYNEYGVFHGIGNQIFCDTQESFQKAPVLLEFFNILKLYQTNAYQLVESFIRDVRKNKVLKVNKHGEPPIYFADFVTDDFGNIQEGIQYKEEAGVSYYKKYKENKVILKKEINLEDFQIVYGKWLDNKYSRE